MYLLEVEEAATYILRKAEGLTVDDYLNNQDLRLSATSSAKRWLHYGATFLS